MRTVTLQVAYLALPSAAVQVMVTSPSIALDANSPVAAFVIVTILLSLLVKTTYLTSAFSGRIVAMRLYVLLIDIVSFVLFNEIPAICLIAISATK